MDEDEFNEFYAASYRRVVGQLYAMIGDRDEAQECVQEAFAKAWAHRRRLARDSHPEAWVRTTPTVQPALDETHVAVVAALRKIPEAQRRAVVLHHFGDLSVAQIALETDAPEGTVKARLSRGRSALAALLSERTERTERTEPADGDVAEGARHV